MSTYNAIKAKLLDRIDSPPLTPEKIWDASLDKQIEELDIPPICKAGLYLLNDHVAACHEIVQAIPAATGSYWHAIVHRREPDYSNSKYWLQRAEDHPVMELIKKKYPEWNAIDFVDWCSNLEGPPEEWLKEVQAFEMAHLLSHSEAQMDN